MQPAELNRITADALAAIHAAKKTDDIALRVDAIDKSNVLKSEFDRLKTEGKLPADWSIQYGKFTDRLLLEKKSLSAYVPGISTE